MSSAVANRPPDDEIARAMFWNEETVDQRIEDVKTTEQYANTLSEYEPLVNDWRGVDDKGDSAQGNDPLDFAWEFDDGVAESDMNKRVYAEQKERGVVGYVNWYGDDLQETVVKPKKYIPWTYEMDDGGHYPMIVLHQESKLYRTTRVVPYGSVNDRKWYTTAIDSVPYFDTGFTQSKVKSKKEIAVYKVKRESLRLVDMTRYQSVSKMLKLIMEEGNMEAYNACRDAFKWAEVNGTTHFVEPGSVTPATYYAIQRDSVNAIDDTFCAFFDSVYGENQFYDGWCFIKSRNSAVRKLQLHHDEIYLMRPEEALEREAFSIREKIDYSYSTAGMRAVNWGPAMPPPEWGPRRPVVDLTGDD